MAADECRCLTGERLGWEPVSDEAPRVALEWRYHELYGLVQSWRLLVADDVSPPHWLFALERHVEAMGRAVSAVLGEGVS